MWNHRNQHHSSADSQTSGVLPNATCWWDPLAPSDRHRQVGFALCNRHSSAKTLYFLVKGIKAVDFIAARAIGVVNSPQQGAVIYSSIQHCIQHSSLQWWTKALHVKTQMGSSRWRKQKAKATPLTQPLFTSSTKLTSLWILLTNSLLTPLPTKCHRNCQQLLPNSHKQLNKIYFT